MIKQASQPGRLTFDHTGTIQDEDSLLELGMSGHTLEVAPHPKGRGAELNNITRHDRANHTVANATNVAANSKVSNTKYLDHYLRPADWL